MGLFFIFLPGRSDAKTIVLQGELKARIHIIQQMEFSVKRPLRKFRYRFGLPMSFRTRTVSQRISNLRVNIYPPPQRLEDDYDRFGNHFKVAYWEHLSRDVTVQVEFDVQMNTSLEPVQSTALVPPRALPPEVQIYLSPTEQVQSTAPEIQALAQRLTKGAASEFEAVAAVVNYVIDNIKYTYNPPQYDALYTLRTKKGNCQNFAHLSMALLRAVGIPARIVGGISLKQPWKVPVGKKTSIVQSMGQGGHAWLEVYYPDLGWLSYDPQQTKEFTSTRHIKQTHGLDSEDINDSWRASPYLPEYSDSIEARFVQDSISLRPTKYFKRPRSYLLSSPVLAKAAMKPPPPVPEKERPPVPKGRVFEFGNIDFPTLVDIYRVVGNRGVRVLDKETAEYVTSRYVYAQAFEVTRPLMVKKVSLAMHKFGGDGTVYIDLVSDRQGRPGFVGTRSLPLFLENIKRRPGYYWVDFGFVEPVVLKPGRYWIVVRHSGDVIMNWFYIPGNPYGQADDTRSTQKGYRWQDILNYDFVFKVTAVQK